MPSEGPAPAKDPRVLCCVLNWNGLTDTEECVASLLRLDDANSEVLVVDNGSREDEASLLSLRFPGQIKTLRLEANEGFAGGMNRGLSYALEHGYAFALLLNNDCVVDPALLTHLRQEMARPGVGLVGPVVCYYDHPSIANSAGSRFRRNLLKETRLGRNEPVERLPKDPYEVDFVDGSCMLVSLAAVREVGRLDPVYFAYWEEVDWALRFRQKGYRVVCVPAARTFHKIGRSTGGDTTDFHTYAYWRNELRFVRRNPARGRTLPRVVQLAWDLARGSVRVVRGRRAGAPRAFVRYLELVLRAIAWNLRGESRDPYLLRLLEEASAKDRGAPQSYRG